MNFNIGPVTDSFLESCIQEIKRRDTRDKILNNVLYPMFGDIYIKYYYYFMFVNIVLLLILVLLIFIIINMKNINKKIII